MKMIFNPPPNSCKSNFFPGDLTALKIKSASGLCVRAAVVLLLFLQAGALNAQGFKSVTSLSPFSVSKNSGEVSQSKVWKYDGKWWTVFPNSSGTYIWKLQGTTWTSVLKISSSSATKADCKVLNSVCHILLWREYDHASQLVSVQYDLANQNYVPWSKRPSITSIALDAGVETSTLDIDASGRMWLASDGIDDIRVRWSDPPYQTWSAPIILASGVSTDDIGTVVSLPQQEQVAVFWSNQVTQRFGFKTHKNGAPPGDWSADEVPARQSALNIRSGMADDHMDLAVASDGTLYCAFKTGYDTDGYPQLGLLRRQPNGVWDDAYPVSNVGTKPIVILNETSNKLKVIFPAESGGNLLYSETSLPTISFGSTLTLLSGTYDNPTSTKDNYDPDIVVLATDNFTKNIVGVLGTDATPSLPGAPTLLAPANASSDQPSNLLLRWNESQYASTYRVQVSRSSDFSTLFADKSGITTTSHQVENLSLATMYYWRVLASNGLGNSAWSQTWNFTVTNSSDDPGLVAQWRLDEGAGTTILDNSGNGNNGTTIGSPSWTTGISGTAMLLNGTNQYAAIPDNATLDIKSQITVSAWVRPAQLSSQKIVIKGDSKTVDGYELSLLSTGKVTFKINQYSSDIYKLNSTTLYPTNGTWMHIAATFDGTVMSVYINGVQDKRISFSGPIPIATNNLSLFLGASVDETSEFAGAMDDIRIYNYAMNESEIHAVAALPEKNNSTSRANQTAPPRLAIEEKVTDVIEIYPSPADNNLFVNLPAAANYTILISDLYGRTLYKTSTGGFSTNLDRKSVV